MKNFSVRLLAKNKIEPTGSRNRTGLEEIKIQRQREGVEKGNSPPSSPRSLCAGSLPSHVLTLCRLHAHGGINT